VKKSTFVLIFSMVLWSVVLIFSSWDQSVLNTIDLEKILMPPSSESLFGSDDLGRSIGPRIVSGARLSIFVVIIVLTITSVFGTLIGILSGLVGGTFDSIVMRVIDIFLSFPGILLAISLAGILGGGLHNVVLALSAVGWVGFARLSRAQTLRVKQLDHVLVAQLFGTTTPKIIILHVLPLIVSPMLVELTYSAASVILSEAGLSFLGIGVSSPTASLGSMVRDGSFYLMTAPHYVILTGMALMSLVFLINVAGDRLQEKLAEGYSRNIN